MTRIDPAALAERLAGNPIARRIVVLEETPSTNLAAKALARRTRHPARLCSQTGRRQGAGGAAGPGKAKRALRSA